MLFGIGIGTFPFPPTPSMITHDSAAGSITAIPLAVFAVWGVAIATVPD
jgi:hypothetical protein